MSKTPMTDESRQRFEKWRKAVTFTGMRKDVDISKPPPDGFELSGDLERALNECEAALKTDYYDTLGAKLRREALAAVTALREKYK